MRAARPNIADRARCFRRGECPSRQRHSQGGFAILLVFAMAAVAAIFLYMQLPRVAFEAQRDRESLLIERGKDYQRAIELYVRKNNKYPERLEDLERQQEMRYLRRRHKDPLTGKDDWRVIRISVSGELENSLVQKKRVPTGRDPTAAELLGDDANVAENLALSRQRSGDQLAANAEFPGAGNAGAAGGGRNRLDGVQEGTGVGGAETPPANPLDAGLVPLLDSSGNVIENAQNRGESQDAGAAGDATQASLPGMPGTGPRGESASGNSEPRLGPGGIPIIENPAAAMAGTGDQNGNQQGTQGAGLPGIGVPGGAAAGTPAAGQQGRTGAEIIGGLLTTPVPGGLAGIQQRRGAAAGGTAGSQGFGAGIAGVASIYEMRGIKVFDEQESIHKWEFVFDARKQANRNSQNQSGARTPGAAGVGGDPTFGPGGRLGRPASGGPGTQ